MVNSLFKQIMAFFYRTILMSLTRIIAAGGNIIMAHGRSDARDIKNAIGLAKRMAHEGWWRGPAAQEDEKSREHPRASKSAGLAIDPNPIRET